MGIPGNEVPGGWGGPTDPVAGGVLDLHAIAQVAQGERAADVHIDEAAFQHVRVISVEVDANPIKTVDRQSANRADA